MIFFIPTKYQSSLQIISQFNNSKIIHTAAWGYFYYRLSRANFKPNHLWKDMSSKDWLLERFGKGSFMPNHSWLVSRELTEIAGPWDETLLRNQDGEYFARVVSSGDYVKFHPLAKCYYRKGNLNSISSYYDEKKIESIIISMRKSTSYLLKMENNKVNRHICIKYFQDFYNKYYFYNNPLLSSLVEEEITKLGGRLLPPVYSRKFNVINNMLGNKNAVKFKSLIWNLEIYLIKSFEKFVSYIFSDSI